MKSKKSIKSIILRHLDGELTIDELKELSDWINKSKENSRFFTEVKDIWEASVSNASKIAETDKEWERFLMQIKKRKSYSNNLRQIASYSWKVAAVFIIGLFIGGLVIQKIFKPEPVYFTSIAPKGSVSQLYLPDSSLVYLNAGSEIRYKIDPEKNNREVFLNGEAWFQVTRMVKKPFVVHTPYYNVSVLGTIFNVKAYPSDARIETTLEEGKVLITSSDAFKMAEDVELSPGDQFTYDKTQNMLQVKKVDAKIYSSWKDNKLIFLNMNFNELIKLMERKYGVEIEVVGNLNYHYSGTLKNETILELLEIIKHTLPIQYKIEGQKILIYKNNF